MPARRKGGGSIECLAEGAFRTINMQVQMQTFGIVTVGCKPRIQLFISDVKLSADENKNIQRYKPHI